MNIKFIQVKTVESKYTDFEVVRWDTVYKLLIPEKVKKVWRGIMKKRKKEKIKEEKLKRMKLRRIEKRKVEEPNPL